MPFAFHSFNEADVREEIIAPLLRRLGYAAGSGNGIIREQSLRYPRISLGRKNPQGDPELRGKADYILEAGGRLRWVVEAKAPDVKIDPDVIEQAYTYANHPEVRALYFVICNGRSFSVFRTADAPAVGPLFSLGSNDFDSRFQQIANVLSPEALLRDFPGLQVDLGLPLAPGLRSIARITGGMIRYDHSSLGHPLLKELQIGVTYGAIERSESGGLFALLRTAVPFRSLQEFNERLGLNEFEMTGTDSELSANPSHPTVFSYQARVALPAGEEFLDLNSWQHKMLAVNVTCDVKAEASGVYDAGILSGKFASTLAFRELALSLMLSGSFDIHLA